MPAKTQHDILPPPSWPTEITYLNKPRLSPSFPQTLVPFLAGNSNNSFKFAPYPTPHPPTIQIRKINDPSHPAHGQYGLFAKKKIPGGELIIPYLGIIHASFIPIDEGVTEEDEHSSSDYDLSLKRMSASDPDNPFGGYHISTGIDAAKAGNAGRFVNDYRGIASMPNAEFRVGQGGGGELRMEIWALKSGIGKGEEVLVSYGKGWWGARKAFA